LRADEGRETKALNCKPITNLKEKSELSNYCKPAAFVCTLLPAVFSHSKLFRIRYILFWSVVYFLSKFVCETKNQVGRIRFDSARC
jgi:hypothetical protein